MAARAKMLGLRFGRLVVIREAAPAIYRNGKERRVLVRCDCGTRLNVLGASLRSGRTRSCGCLRREMTRAANLAKTGKFIGRRFGRLRVTRELPPLKLPDGRAERWVAFKCDCGNVGHMRLAVLVSGHTKSCGCLKSEATRKRSFRHGDSVRGKTTKEYYAWRGMKGRCYNPRNEAYEDYGGRGIKVCKRWRNNFPAFLADVGRAPSPKHSLDRFPDNDGDYRPGNTRWATDVMQANNRRKRRKRKK